MASVEELLHSVAEVRSIAGETADPSVLRRLEHVVDILDAEVGALTEAAGAARRELRGPARRRRGGHLEG